MSDELTEAERDAAAALEVQVAALRDELAGLEAQLERGAAKRRADEVRARLAELTSADERSSKQTRPRAVVKETR